jgi:hypothetical protein
MLTVDFKNTKLYPLKRQSSLPCLRKSPSERDDKPSIFGSKMYKNHSVQYYVCRTLCPTLCSTLCTTSCPTSCPTLCPTLCPKLCPTFPSHAHFLVLQLSIKLPLQNSWFAKFEIVCALLLLVRSTQKSSMRHFKFFKDVWCYGQCNRWLADNKCLFSTSYCIFEGSLLLGAAGRYRLTFNKM